MKLVRLILACTLLLLVSLPVFALPQCGECIENQCVPSSTSGLPCRYDGSGMCEYYIKNCTSRVEPVLTDWTVASIEISCPAPEAEVATTLAEADAVPTIETVAQK
jgi:hypothetical protein